jgi:hypothetical protein
MTGDTDVAGHCRYIHGFILANGAFMTNTALILTKLVRHLTLGIRMGRQCDQQPQKRSKILKFIHQQTPIQFDTCRNFEYACRQTRDFQGPVPSRPKKGYSTRMGWWIPAASDVYRHNDDEA